MTKPALSPLMRTVVFAAVALICLPKAARCAPSEVEGELVWKARHFDRLAQQYHVRDGGLVAGVVRLPYQRSADESDENGAYLTGAYLAALSFRFAATGEPAARQQAARCFRSVQKLVAVTGGKGLLARWYKVAPAPSPSENEGWLAGHWHQSAEYRWLGNVSVDQYCGALFGLAAYHRLAAPAELRPQVEALVADMVGRILDAGMVITDLDGKPTTWSDMSPTGLQEPMYALMGLGFLRIAAEVTAEKRFAREYDRLLNECDYAARALPTGGRTAADWNFSDDVMAWEMLYNLLLLERRSEEKARLGRVADAAWELVQGQKRVLFDIIRSATANDAAVGKEAVRQLFLMPAEQMRVEGRERTYPAADLDLRPPSWFQWVDPPYAAIEGERYAGVDYLLAYWMARYHGLVAGTQADQK